MTRRGALGLLAGGVAACAGAPGDVGVLGRPPVPIEPLAPSLWWVPAAPGDGSAADRGRVSNLLIAVAGDDGWLLGSGPTPAFGRALRAALDARWPGRRWTVVHPWAHPEAVLGAAGLGAVELAAHDDVARQMAARCAGCIERLRVRLGAAASDLDGGDPVRLPSRRLHGERGRLGPFDWWRVTRDDATTTTVWAHRDSAVVHAPGLLWGEGAPDGRDADIEALARATAGLATLPGLPESPRWLGGQGGPGADAAARASAYWQALLAAVARGLDDGDSGVAPPASLPGVGPAMLRDPRHALNWQRAWRQSEERWLQRSLR